MLETVAAGAHLLHPSTIKRALLLVVRNPHGSHHCPFPAMAMLDIKGTEFGAGHSITTNLDLQRSPLHELDDVLYLHIIGLQLIDVTEQVLGQCTTVGIARHAAFGSRMIRAFERRPEHDLRSRTLHPFGGNMRLQRPEVKRSDILGKVTGMGVVGRMRCNGVCVMIHAGNHACTLSPVETRPLDTGRGSAGTTEKVDIQKLGCHKSNPNRVVFRFCGLPGVEPGQRLRQAVGSLRRRGGPANPSVSLAACGCATVPPAASAPSRNPPHGSCPRSSGAAAPSAGRCRAARIRPPPAAASAARGPGRRRR